MTKAFYIFGMAVLFVWFIGPSSGMAGDTMSESFSVKRGGSPPGPSIIVLPDTLPAAVHPDSIPYRAETGLGREILRIPASILHLAIMPLKWGVIWSQEYQVYDRLSDLFLNEERTAGFYPNFSVGGRTAFAAGITYFNRDVAGTGHSLDVNTFYTNAENFKLGVNYKIPPEQLQRYQLTFNGNMRLNDDQNIFLGGNSSSDDLEASYRIEHYSLQTEAGYLVTPGILAELTLGLTHAVIRDISMEAAEGEAPLPSALQSEGFGLGKATLLHTGLGMIADNRRALSRNTNDNLLSTITTSYDFKQTKIRVYSGSLFDLGVRYNRSTTGRDYEYLNYYGDWQQFFPLPGLPLDRRLALRARLQKRYPLGNSSVPFYEKSILGDAANLRGYRQDRFRDLGSLLLTLEYRYPIWDTWDAVLFTDQGQVFHNYRQIDLDQFHGAYGTGLRFMTASDFLFRVEIAFSREGTRSLMEFSMNF
ncbi:BamA/TamA family outer membrane protein [Fodinibius sediminis]|uniref:Surface antigen n=1 Tax=Fodinibius sediminis TaxID=1214077 RepID=A0A521BX90_9BACT|nr:BamA/TamA family outer membrane protein [Fodinibius sediminis]SMO51788.1 Surface antigen [Fodinibius sediminis]